MPPRYPEIKVQLSGRDGNAYSIIGSVESALRGAKVAPETIEAFVKEALSGGYDRVLQTAMKWVDVS
jgi:hypothetical protein